MHEMGIASSVLEELHKQVDPHPGHRVTKIGLRIGEYAGVDQESLRFCFEALVKGSELDPLALEIDLRSESDALEIAYLELESPIESGLDSMKEAVA